MSQMPEHLLMDPENTLEMREEQLPPLLSPNQFDLSVARTEVPDRAQTFTVVIDGTQDYQISRQFEAMIRHTISILANAPDDTQIGSLIGLVDNKKREKIDITQGRDRLADDIDEWQERHQTVSDQLGDEEEENVALADRLNAETSRATGNWWFGFVAACFAVGTAVAWLISTF